MSVRKVAGAVRAGMWAVAVAALAPSVAAANDDARTGRITYFEPLRALPAAPSSAQRKAGGSSMQQLRFDAFGRRFDISLGSNDRLMMSKPAHSQLELYSGAIDGIAGSWVRLATKGDVLHGMMWDGTQLYAIEPAAEVRDALAQPLPADAPQTIVFRLADVTIDPGAASCASESSPTKASDAFDALAGELKNSAVAMQALGATRRLDVAALSDANFRARYGSDQQARDAILTRLNNVDGIFSSQLAIEIHVASVSAAGDQLERRPTGCRSVMEAGLHRDVAVVEAIGVKGNPASAGRAAEEVDDAALTDHVNAPLPGLRHGDSLHDCIGAAPLAR